MAIKEDGEFVVLVCVFSFRPLNGQRDTRDMQPRRGWMECVVRWGDQEQRKEKLNC